MTVTLCLRSVLSLEAVCSTDKFAQHKRCCSHSANAVDAMCTSADTSTNIDACLNNVLTVNAKQVRKIMGGLGLTGPKALRQISWLSGKQR
jgi:hypothetical protein